MFVIVYPGADGVISQAGRVLGQPLPAGAVVVDYNGPDDLTLPPSSAAVLRDGKVEIVPNWVGSGPWYDQAAPLADREVPIHITELGVDPSTKNWKMMPRPLTKAEIKAAADAEAEAKAAQEAAEAAAAAQAEIDRIANLEVEDTQLALAMRHAGLMTQEEAEGYAAGSTTLPAAFEAGLLALPEAVRGDARVKILGAKRIKRSDPIVAAIGTAAGASAADLDKIFLAASAL